MKIDIPVTIFNIKFKIHISDAKTKLKVVVSAEGINRMLIEEASYIESVAKGSKKELLPKLFELPALAKLLGPIAL